MTITRVPAVSRSIPMIDLALIVSCRKINARINVSTVLILSTGTTFEASPT